MSQPAGSRTADKERPPLQFHGASAVADLASVPPAWLVDFDGKTAEAVDRLVEDGRLYQALRAQDFEGSAWDRFKDALARYGLPVLRSWLHTGAVFEHCRERGLVTERRVKLGPDQVVELASVTVAEAIAAFRAKVLRPGRWDPERGASLRTFFIGQCLLRFPRVYSRWLRDEREWDLTDDPERHQIPDPSPSPATVAETRLLLAATLTTPLGRRLAQVLFLADSGYGQAEIARRLGVSLGSVESLLYRHRRKEGA